VGETDTGLVRTGSGTNESVGEKVIRDSAQPRLTCSPSLRSSFARPKTDRLTPYRLNSGCSIKMCNTPPRAGTSLRLNGRTLPRSSDREGPGCQRHRSITRGAEYLLQTNPGTLGGASLSLGIIHLAGVIRTLWNSRPLRLMILNAALKLLSGSRRTVRTESCRYLSLVNVEIRERSGAYVAGKWVWVRQVTVKPPFGLVPPDPVCEPAMPNMGCLPSF